MADRRFAAGAAAGLAAAGAVWLASELLARSQPERPRIEAVRTFEQPGAAVEPASHAAALPPPESATPEPPSAPPAGAGARLALPVFDKLVAAPLSAEPHEVVGAWDEDGEGAEPGERRAFVLTVAPGRSDASLEALARDVRARNLDARILEVRIYDDAAAATAPRIVDAGQSSRAHLMAEVKRNPAANLDVLRVRGKDLSP